MFIDIGTIVTFAVLRRESISLGVNLVYCKCLVAVKHAKSFCDTDIGYCNGELVCSLSVALLAWDFCILIYR